MRVVPKWMQAARLLGEIGEAGREDRFRFSPMRHAARWLALSTFPATGADPGSACSVSAADHAFAIHRELEEHHRIALLLLSEGEDSKRQPLSAGVRGIRAVPGGSGGGGCSTFTAISTIGCVYCASGMGLLSMYTVSSS